LPAVKSNIDDFPFPDKQVYWAIRTPKFGVDGKFQRTHYLGKTPIAIEILSNGIRYLEPNKNKNVIDGDSRLVTLVEYLNTSDPGRYTLDPLPS